MPHMTREHGMSASVVCGIDGSGQARGALTVAAALGVRLGLRLVIAHAVPVPPPSPDLAPLTRIPPDLEALDLTGAERGRRLLDQAAAAFPESVTRLEQGGAAGCLVGVAREAHAGLLVVGTRGEGAMKAALLGSVSLDVARDAPCPVVVAPPAATGPPLAGDRVLCGVDTEHDRRAVETATWLARALDLPLTLAHVVPDAPGRGTRSRAPADAAHAGRTAAPSRARAAHGHARTQRPVGVLGASVVVADGDPAHELARLAAADAALVVVGCRGLGPLRAGLLGSVSRRLVREAVAPVVLCRHEEPA